MVASVLLILARGLVPMLFYALIFWWFDRYGKDPYHRVLHGDTRSPSRLIRLEREYQQVYPEVT